MTDLKGNLVVDYKTFRHAPPQDRIKNIVIIDGLEELSDQFWASKNH